MDVLQNDLRVRARAALGASAAALLTRLAVEGDRGVQFRIAVELLIGDTSRDQAIAALERLRGGDDPAAAAASSVLDSGRRRDRPRLPRTGGIASDSGTS
ncbi:hypothetical protein [Streptosporangium roseum]|uniref:hypothetical protein n=1 Tax=Streptosporangium roseum TaxID=2001 RepID=UPI0001A3DED9|nr:hypothetical protein [Streptosporangium roseum]